MSQLIQVLGRAEMHRVSLALDMEDFHKVFPDARRTAKPDLPGLIYGMMTKFSVLMLAPPFIAVDPTVKITLVQPIALCSRTNLLPRAS